MKFLYRVLIVFFLIPIIPLHAKHPPFIVITPEKCGTFLLSKALKLLTGKSDVHYFPRKAVDLQEFFGFVQQAEKGGQFVFCHVSPDKPVIDGLKRMGYKVFFILRDPRDQLISGMFMIRNGHPLAGIPSSQFKQLDTESQIEELIMGELFGAPIFEVCYQRMLPWVLEDSSFVHISRFEELVGTQGGGDDRWQLEGIKSIGDHLGMKISSKKAKQIGKSLFGDTWSFRQGKIGEYKAYFTERLFSLYEAKYSRDLAELGYGSGF